MDKLTEYDKRYNHYIQRHNIAEKASMNYYQREWEEFKKKNADKKKEDEKEIK